jgi:hypothetical protein
MKPEGLDGMHPGIFAAWRHLRESGPGLVGRLPAAGLDEGWWYYNRYPYDFTDTNNLSVVSYFQWGNFGVLFGGDMEGEGWDALLENTDLARHLPFVRVYVAAHHGRENGKSERLFRNMQPDLVLVSDGPVQHLTQHTANWYGSRTLGALVHGPSLTSPPQFRRVLSTRQDGTIRINVGHRAQYRVVMSRTPTLRPGRSLFMEHT